MPEATQPNQRWSLDFLADNFGASRKFRILAVNGDCCRENLRPGYGHPLRYLRAARVAITLNKRFLPRCYGTEFTSRAILK